MDHSSNITEVRRQVDEARADGLNIGFVPTMGAFHRGHTSLIEASARICGWTVVSIFVNPTQFAPNEDLDSYPRTLKSDLAKAQASGADLVFAPSAEQMYPSGFKTYVEVEELGHVLCGKSRPGHFRGVVTVVAKLLNIIRPDALFLGRKDAQQAIIIARMVEDLDFTVEVKMRPTVREADGLAMSSRNQYLSVAHRTIAPRLFEALSVSGRLFDHGERNAAKLVDAAASILRAESEIDVEYIEIRKARGLEPAESINESSLLFVAAKLGETRLIDNIILDPEMGSFEA
ncbi:pantoate--beta-alanine ligase [bacterium]|nr:pantoate--beta-alanine ligase [bacterium]